MRKLWVILWMLCFGMLSAQTYHIGDVYTAPDGSRGIVYYLHPDGSGGWVVALTDASTACRWGDYTDVPGLANQDPSELQALLHDTAGYANTLALRNHQNNNSSYAAGVVDFEHGWVFPSPAQLSMLYAQLPFISSALTDAGGTNLSEDMYWCSAEKNEGEAWLIHFTQGNFNTSYKMGWHSVRAVRSFTYEPTYLWSTGDTTPTITVTPMQATEYTVTVTGLYGCSNTASQTIAMQNHSVFHSDKVYLCPDSSMMLTSRPSGSYLWNTGDTTRSITISTSGVYTVAIVPADGCPTVDTFRVVTVKVNGISNIDIPDMCAGSSYTITVGHDSSNNVTVVSHETVLAMQDTVFLPDGVECDPYGCSYRSSLTFAGYADTAKVNSVNDIRYLRINMEHSYAGDLYINIICPNGKKADILKWGYRIYSSECASQISENSFGWQSDVADNYNAPTNTDFGLAKKPSDSEFPCDPGRTKNLFGTGWNYCWSNNNAHGYTYAGGTGSLIYRSCNAHNYGSFWNSLYIFDSSNVAMGTQFYHPDESFDSLVGCPLNGSWCIEVMDGNNIDNGYIFGWELALAEDIQTVEYVDVVRTTVDGPWVTAVNDSSFVISPPADLPHDTLVAYTFHCMSAYGCGYDTVVEIQFYARSFLATDTFVCGDYTWKGITYSESAVFSDTLANIHGCDSLVTTHFIVVEPPVNLVTGPAGLCEGEPAEFTACDAVTYLWSTGDTTQSVIISDSGSYTLSVTDIHGCVFDTVFHVSPTPLTYTYLDTVVCDQLEWMDSVYNESGTYTRTFSGSNGCDSIVVINLIIPENPIVGAHLSDMVAGDTQLVCIGKRAEDNLQYLTPITTMSMGDTVFLPDGVECEPYGCSYQAMLTFSDFADTAVIRSAEDIHYVRLNMEHSFIKDLYINFKCPNNQHAALLKYGGSGESDCLSSIPVSGRGWQGGDANVGEAFLGWAFDDHDAVFRCDPTKWLNRPGKGWNYCWSNNTTHGYQYAYGEGSLIHRMANAHQYTINYEEKYVIDSSHVAAGTQFYRPAVSFDSLVGCPLNGTWTIEVMDGLPNDNGYLFFWEISLADDLLPHHYASVANRGFDGLWTSRVTDSTFVITPPYDLPHDTVVTYTFTLTDENGCTFDTTVEIHFYANRYSELFDTVEVSELDYTWNGVLFSGPGTDTAVLQTVHAADSIITMHLSVIYPYDTTVCEDKLPLEWHGHTIARAGTQSFSYPVDGADSIVRLTVNTLPLSYMLLTVAVLENNMPYTLNGETYDSTGTYTQTLTNALGCDSVLTIELYVINNSTVQMDTTVCEDQLPLTWHGQEFVTAGTQFDTLTASTGADSILMVTVTTLALSYDTLQVTVVENDLPYVLNGVPYDTTGRYTQQWTNAANCDSLLTIDLTVFYNSTIPMDSTVCEDELPFVWEGMVFTAAGTQTDTLTASTGADSVLVLTLIVKDTTSETLYISRIENDLPLILNGFSYDSTGVYTQHLTNAEDCDSLLTIVLTVYSNAHTEVDSVVCANDLPLVWNGVLFDTADTLVATLPTAFGADSVIVMRLTVNPSPVANITGPSILCAGQSVVLTSDTADIYLWNTGAVTPSIVVDEVGIYRVTVTNAYACSDSSQFLLTHLVTVLPIDTISLTDMCVGEQYPVTIGHQNGSSIVIASAVEVPVTWTDTVPLTIDTTEVSLVTVEGPWVTVVSDTAFLFSPPENLERDTLVSYTFHLSDTNHCGYDTTVLLHVYTRDHTVIDTAVCDSYTWNDVTYAESGQYIGSFVNRHGCDSTVTLNLAVYHTPDAQITGPSWICQDSTVILSVDSCYAYLWSTGDTTRTIAVSEAGSYSVTVMEEHGCNQSSTHTVETPDNPIRRVNRQEICATATCPIWVGTTSTYSVMIRPNANIIDVDVQGIWLSSEGYSVPTVCPPADLSQDTTLLYDVTLTEIHGCPFDTTVAVTVYHLAHSTLDTVVCGSFPYGDSLYTQSGTYEHHFTDSHGCDSTVMLTLMVLALPEAHISGPEILCSGETIVLTADSAVSYLWNTGDTTASIVVDAVGTYTVTVTNELGCPDSALFRVIHLVTVNPIDTMQFTDMCAGNDYPITIGHRSQSSIVIGNPVTSLSWADTVFLPDGTYCEPYGCSYRSPLVFTDFAEGAEVSSVDDILYVRLNLEHSFAGDLYINITCPNGQKADILRFNGTANSDCSSSIPLASRHWQQGDNAGTGTFFGMAYDYGVQSCNESLPYNAPGIGWNYCWSNNANAGYTYASGEGGLIYRYDNAHYQDNFYDMSPQRVRVFDSSDVVTGTQFYHPDQSFASLIGCPLNGPWYIEVMDGFNVDNGYLFGWELALAPHLVPGEHTDVASVTMDGPWVTPVSDTAFIVSPPEALAHDTVITYTFHLSDTIGCGYDTTVTLNVYARSFTVIDTSACDSFTWNGNAYTNSGQYIDTFANRHGCDSIVTLNLTVYPTPVVQIEGPSWVCRDSVVVFSVDSCAAYLWSTGDITRMISVAEAGTYSVTVTEEHGCSYTATHDLATPANPILSVNSPEICADTISPITVGTSSGSTVVLSANASNFIIDFQGLWLSDSGMSAPAVCPPADLEQDTAVVCAVMLVDTNGCHFDTTVTVTVYSLSHSSFDTVVCDSFTYAGVTYSESGQYEHAFETVHGCDSVVTFTLTVNRSVEVYDTLYLLQNQLPYYIASADMTISTVGDVQLQYSLSTLQGCDSLIRLQVYVYQNVEVTIDTTVCPSSLPLAWYGHTFPAEGTAVDSLQTAHGSDSIRIYHVFVDNLAVAIGNVTHVDCYGASTGAATAQVTGGQSPLSYLWQNAAGGTVSTTVQMANVAAGAYSFTVTDHFGCTSTDTVTIRTLHDELVPGTIAASQELCDGEALAPFTGTAASGGDNGGYQWQYSEDGETWTAAPGLSTTQDYTCTEPPAESFQLRRAWISATCGTVYSNVVTVAFWPSYQDTLTVWLCQGGSYWENGFEVDETMTGDPGTYFFVQQLTTGHCDSVVVLQLTVNPMYENHIEDEVCEGDGYFANGFSIPAAETLGKDTLLRNLSLQTEQGCDSVVWLHLTIVDTATRIVLLSPDFCETLTAELGVETALSDYEWSTGELTPQITVTLPGIYSVTATQGGCSATARYTIEPCALRVLLPNAISPSKSDGLNDYLFIPEALLASIYDFEISVFNRWGEMVFYSTDKHFKWNGEVKGTIFYNNVYNYVIRCTNAQGKPYVFTGSITVL